MAVQDLRIFLITLILFILATTASCCLQNNIRTESGQPKNINSLLNKIHLNGSHFVDSTNRVRIFHGFNAVEKEFPWFPDYLLNETKLELYKSWGFNAVRLGTMWAGFQPTEGKFNQTYIDILKQIVTKLDKYGMYALMDMHQDVISSALGSYDGVPLWLIKKFPPSPHPYPWPLKNITAWAEGYITQAVSEAFQYLYKNNSGAMDYFSQFWQEVARQFKDFDNVLGYELINEPWAGDVYSDPLLLLPGEAGRRNLLPVYDILNSVIRKEDNTTLLFYEPVTWGVVANGDVLGSGFSRVPGGSSYQNISVLSYHWYCWVLEIASAPGNQDYPIIERDVCDKVLGPRVFESVLNDLKKTGGGSFLTEFGECDPDGNPNSTSTIECGFIMAEADKHLQSWTYWDSLFFDKDGNVRLNNTKAFSRPYAMATAGTPLSMSFDTDSRHFHFEFESDPVITGVTEVFIPSLHYQEGFDVELTDGFQWKFDKGNSTLDISQKSKNRALKKVTLDVYPVSSVRRN